MKKTYIVATLALALTLGFGTAAYAWQNGNHHNGHQRTEHQGSYQPSQQAAPNYYQHGGEQENAADNNTVHENELQSGNHVDPGN